jgi:hypothetical protein
MQNTYFNGLLHSFNDQPATIDQDGCMTWYYLGEIHRGNDLPAVVIIGERYEWWTHGVPGRGGDKPAVVTRLVKEWIIDDQLHRDGGQPAVVWYNGDVDYFVDGMQHRDNAPAVILQGHQIYYKNDEWVGHHDDRRGWLTKQESHEIYHEYSRKRAIKF